MDIDVVDVSDPRLMPTKTGLEKIGKSKVLSYCFMSNGVNQMVHDIMGIAAPNSIKVLRIWAHGTQGVVGISSGDDPRLIRLHLSGISPKVFDSPYQELGKLRPYFASGARIELRGCETGASADGEKLMKNLAELLGVEIHASPEDQPGTGFDWYGVVYVAKPGRSQLPLLSTSGIALKP